MDKKGVTSFRLLSLCKFTGFYYSETGRYIVQYPATIIGLKEASNIIMNKQQSTINVTVRGSPYKGVYRDDKITWSDGDVWKRMPSKILVTALFS